MRSGRSNWPIQTKTCQCTKCDQNLSKIAADGTCKHKIYMDKDQTDRPIDRFQFRKWFDEKFDGDDHSMYDLMKSGESVYLIYPSSCYIRPYKVNILCAISGVGYKKANAIELILAPSCFRICKEKIT